MTQPKITTPTELLAHTAHRPFDLPQGRPWVMAQTWEHLLFAHYPVPIATVRDRIPPALEIDTFEGSAWVGVVPFLMNHVRVRGFPPMYGTRKFPELNLRTYVKNNGKAGVWFFSLDAANPLAVWIARLTFNLPYFQAEMSLEARGDTVRYASFRRHPNAPYAEFIGEYTPSAPPQAYADGSLDRWLTERYALYSADRSGKVYIGQITHLPWDLQPAEAEITSSTLGRASRIPIPDTQPLLHYVRKLDILAWAIQAIQ